MKNLSIIKMLLAAIVVLTCGVSNLTASTTSPVLEYNKGLVSCSSENISLIGFLEKLADIGYIEIYVTSKLEDYNIPVDYEQVPVQEVVSSLLRGYSFAVIYTEKSETRGKVYLYDKKTSLDQNNNIVYSNNALNSKLLKKHNGPRERYNDFPEGYHELEDRNISEKNEPIKNSFKNDSRLSSKLDSGFVGSKTSNSSYSASAKNIRNSSTGVSVLDPISEQTNNSKENNIQSVKSASNFQYAYLDEDEKKIKYLESKIEKLEKDIESGRADEFYDFWTQSRDPMFVYNHWDDLERCKRKLAELQDF